MSQIHLYRTIDSTNTAAKQLFNQSEHGEAWLADSQTDGHGRRETGGSYRKWYSPSEQNIYLSVVIKKPIRTEKAPLLTLAVGAMVVDTLLKRFKDIPGLWLKWPNDIYIHEKKLAGILTEGIFDNTGFKGAIVGIGLNINKKNDSPDELKNIITYLSEHIKQDTTDRLTLALEIQESIIKASNLLHDNEIDEIIDLVKKYDQSENKKVIILLNNQEKEGIAKGIDENGSLKVEIDQDGKKEIIEVRSGEAKLISTTPNHQ